MFFMCSYETNGWSGWYYFMFNTAKNCWIDESITYLVFPTAPNVTKESIRDFHSSSLPPTGVPNTSIQLCNNQNHHQMMESSIFWRNIEGNWNGGCWCTWWWQGLLRLRGVFFFQKLKITFFSLRSHLVKLIWQHFHPTKYFLMVDKGEFSFYDLEFIERWQNVAVNWVWFSCSWGSGWEVKLLVEDYERAAKNVI